MNNIILPNNNFIITREFVENTGVKAVGFSSNHAIAVSASYTAANEVRYKTMSAKAANIDYKGAYLYVPTKQNSAALPSGVENKDLSTALMLEKNPALANFIENNSEIQEMLTISDMDLEMAKISLDYNHEYKKIRIEDGKIKIRSSTHSSKGPKEFEVNTILNQVNRDNNLYNGEALEKLEELYNKLYEDFPILNSAPFNADISSIKPYNMLEIFLSRAYGSQADIGKINFLFNYANKYSLEYDVLATLALNMAKNNSSLTPFVSHIQMNDGTWLVLERNEPLRVAFVTQENIDNYKDKLEEERDIGGAYLPDNNLIVTSYEENIFFHEATHATMNLIFSNSSNPYFKENKIIYEKQVQKLLLNIATKLGMDSDKLADKDLSHIIMDIKNNTILDLLTYNILRDPSKSFISIMDLKFKYFLDIEGEISKELIQKTILSKVSDLTTDELYTIAHIGKLIYNYSDESFDKELIATLLELKHSDVEQTIVNKIFEPIIQYWAEYIHPQITSEIEVHHIQCRNDFYIGDEYKMPDLLADKLYDYCIEDL